MMPARSRETAAGNGVLNEQRGMGYLKQVEGFILEGVKIAHL